MSDLRSHAVSEVHPTMYGVYSVVRGRGTIGVSLFDTTPGTPVPVAVLFFDAAAPLGVTASVPLFSVDEIDAGASALPPKEGEHVLGRVVRYFAAHPEVLEGRRGEMRRKLDEARRARGG